MSGIVKGRESKVESRRNFGFPATAGKLFSDCGLRTRNPKSAIRNPQSGRRGVLLLVVLSMLVLFMLIGTAFLMSSSNQSQGAKESAKVNRLGNDAGKLLHRAIMQLLRDSDNRTSAIRYHSLLRRSVRHRRVRGGGVFACRAESEFCHTAKPVPRYAGVRPNSGRRGPRWAN